MIIFGERTYNLAVWSAHNDALDTCGQLNSVSGARLCFSVHIISTALTLPVDWHYARSELQEAPVEQYGGRGSSTIQALETGLECNLTCGPNPSEGRFQEAVYTPYWRTWR